MQLQDKAYSHPTSTGKCEYITNIFRNTSNSSYMILLNTSVFFKALATGGALNSKNCFFWSRIPADVSSSSKTRLSKFKWLALIGDYWGSNCSNTQESMVKEWGYLELNWEHLGL